MITYATLWKKLRELAGLDLDKKDKAHTDRIHSFEVKALK